MYCPKCSQEQLSETTRFCSRCGFLLTAITEIIENDGELPVNPKNEETLSSPRKKGLKQGLFILLLAVLLSPILMILAKEFQIRPAMFILAMFTLFIAGIIRMIYAKIFEPDFSFSETEEQNVFQKTAKFIKEKQMGNILPAAQTNPIDDFIPPMQGKWRDTNDLVETRVTDETTKLLKKDI